MARIVNLLQPGVTNQVKDESIDDTIKDAVNYFAILAAYREEQREQSRD